jgi:ankyrin repeat protein
MGRVTDTGMLQDTSHGSTPLAWAFRERKETLLKKPVAKGINVDLRDKMHDRSALDYACYYGCSRELLRQMLQSSQQLSEPNGDGHYLPHVMCRLWSMADSFLLQELLEAGANPDSCLAPGGFTPMMLAARHGKLDHLQVLLKNGANPYVRDSYGSDILHYAAANDRVSILRALENLDFDRSRGALFRWDSWSSEECNVLHFAASHGANTALRFIAEGRYIPNINCRNANGESPLHLAAEFRGDGETIEILVSHGANIDAESKAGKLAVHYAASSGNESVIRALLQNDCSLEPDARGWTPELVALDCGHLEIALLCTELGPQQGMLVCSYVR